MGDKHKYSKNELADQSDVHVCGAREVTAAIGDTDLSASDGVSTGKFRESGDVTEYQNVESSKARGACSYPDTSAGVALLRSKRRTAVPKQP